MANDKVFASDITRTFNKLKNNLYDLLIVSPVTPLPKKGTKYTSCDFVPKTEKYYIPKRKLRPKVRTVRDIRNIFEKDVCSNLSVDIEKQENILLRKIRSGSSNDERTKAFARNMLKSDKPISRTAWQMVVNINPDNCVHSSQYVLWNGNDIQVNGSRGGKNKFIYNYDLGKRSASLLQKFKTNNLVVKQNLLKRSLDVKFKPGPLSRKKQLDDSYQKYNIGNVELVHLPKPGLEILPEYGKPVEASVANFLYSLRDVNGVISDKWAEFAVSTLGTNDNGYAVQLNKDAYVTFDLGYEYDQRRLLMRDDVNKLFNEQTKKQVSSNVVTENEEIMKREIKKMLDEILISVETTLMENDMYTGRDSPREIDTGDVNTSCENQPKDKIKRKGQSELHRLDVTVIRLCDSHEKKEIETCRKPFCTLGCICDSLLSSYRLKNHCGRIECMFECKCDFNKYYPTYDFKDNIMPELVTLDKEKNSKLSKEEQKFHQTVILSGEKSIVLKSQRRNWKAPEKYADFYSNMCLKTKKDVNRILSVEEVKLNCENIEPWCMIHNLYKCFCKGRFTEKLSCNVSNDEIKATDNGQNSTKLNTIQNLESDLKVKNNELTTKTNLRPRIGKAGNSDVESTKTLTDNKSNSSIHGHRSARVKAYRKRKYNDDFYFNTHKKIHELEQNDHGLHNRIMEILKMAVKEDENRSRNYSTDLSSSPEYSTTDLSSSLTLAQNTQKNVALYEAKNISKSKLATNSTSHKLCGDVITTEFTSPGEIHVNNRLRAWLEPSLKLYRQRFAKGFFKTSLEPPRAGKIALYPWDFIMNRYHEKKNLFLVTHQKPSRIFMAVDHRNILFNSCIDIRSIEDLDEYPASVKSIVTREVDCLADQLCILRGLNSCWELIGSVKKVRDPQSSESDNNSIEFPSDVEAKPSQNLSPCLNSPAILLNNISVPVSLENNTEQSKWFVMTVENDFNEIQFYNRGFFVKYDSIIEAIKVARVTNKTVRLSAQKCSEESSDPQFGIYAIPNANEYCVFIGPYEKNQPLGIETIKTTLRNRKLKTRGVWITTNKVDNSQVIDNPLSFMAQVNLEHEHMLDDTAQAQIVGPIINTDCDKQMLDDTAQAQIVGPIINTDGDILNEPKAKENNKVVKLVKPIKITKTNNFYHLTPSGFLKPITESPEKQIAKTSVVVKKHVTLDLESRTANSSLLRNTFKPQSNDYNKFLCREGKQKPFKRPIAEIAPHIKVVEKRQKTNNTQLIPSDRRFEGGMFILKPEEINSRSLASKICFTPSPTENTVSTVAHNEIDMDIENFLANSVECSAPNNNVYVISDDEDYCNTETTNKTRWKNVWIICNSVKKIGWISGRQDENGYLSFEFPGFKYTEFYPEQDAFAKITQVLARKVYIPDHVSLSWSVIKTKKELHKLKKLRQEDLNPDNVLTKSGLINKFQIAEHVNKNMKTYCKNARKCSSKFSHSAKEVDQQLVLMKSEIDNMDIKSNILLKEGERLLSETMQKKGELSDNISKMSNDRRKTIRDRLQSILSSANCS